jgi:hypothetical protein
MPARRPAGPRTPNLPSRNMNRKITTANMADQFQTEPQFRTTPTQRTTPMDPYSAYNQQSQRASFDKMSNDIRSQLQSQNNSFPNQVINAPINALAAAARSKRLQGVRDFLGF